jgi:hypothetical protein
MTIEALQRDFIKYNIRLFLLVSWLMRPCEAPFHQPVGSNTYIRKVYVIFIMIKRFASSISCLLLYSDL